MHKYGNAPLVIAHRGASKYAPENTLRSFQLAYELGADGIEFDAQLTKDGKVAVFHDATLARLTGKTGAIHHYSMEELNRLDVGVHFSKQFKGEKIPSLSEVLSAWGEKLFINIEMKNLRRPFNQLPIKIIEELRSHNLTEGVIVSSFNPIALIQLKSRAPNIKIGLLLDPSEPKWIRNLLKGLLRFDALHPHESMVDADLLDSERLLNRSVFVWTVDDPSRIEELARQGVSGIITSLPDLAKHTLKKTP